MPEVYLPIEWPDRTTDRIYSPSTIINTYFKAGDQLTVAEFEVKITEALTQASQRVKEKFGFECSSAQAELQRLREAAKDKTGIVRVLHSSSAYS